MRGPEVRQAPIPDRRRLCPLSPEDVVCAHLAATEPRSEAQIRRALAPYVERRAVRRALLRLGTDGLIVRDDARWRLSARGRAQLLPAAVAENEGDWTKTRQTILPVAALGLQLRPATVHRLARGDHLRAAAAVVLYALPLDPEQVRLAEVREGLVSMGLAARFPEIEFPAVTGTARLDSYSVALLRGLAGGDASTVVGVIDSLVRRALGAPDGSLDGLRTALVRAALSLSPSRLPLGHSEAQPKRHDFEAEGVRASPTLVDISEFARRISVLANANATPPYDDRSAIGVLYDVYGQVYADAGSLASFKERLGQAHRERWLSLRRLDYIDAIDEDLRIRSEVQIDGRPFHFVARDS